MNHEKYLLKEILSNIQTHEIHKFKNLRSKVLQFAYNCVKYNIENYHFRKLSKKKNTNKEAIKNIFFDNESKLFITSNYNDQNVITMWSTSQSIPLKEIEVKDRIVNGIILTLTTKKKVFLSINISLSIYTFPDMIFQGELCPYSTNACQIKHLSKELSEETRTNSLIVLSYYYGPVFVIDIISKTIKCEIPYKILTFVGICYLKEEYAYNDNVKKQSYFFIYTNSIQIFNSKGEKYGIEFGHKNENISNAMQLCHSQDKALILRKNNLLELISLVNFTIIQEISLVPEIKPNLKIKDIVLLNNTNYCTDCFYILSEDNTILFFKLLIPKNIEKVNGKELIFQKKLNASFNITKLSAFYNNNKLSLICCSNEKDLLTIT
jgi:hypothetical protein